MNKSPKVVLATLLTNWVFQIFVVSLIMLLMEPSPGLTLLAYFGLSDYSGVSSMNLFGVVVFYITSLFGLRALLFIPLVAVLEFRTCVKIEAKQAEIRKRLHEAGLTLVQVGKTGWTCIKDPQGAVSSIQLAAIIQDVMSVNKKISASACASFANMCEDVKTGKMNSLVSHSGRMKIISTR